MTRHASAVALLAFAGVALAGVLLRPAIPIDETRYLSVAWEMWVKSDWLVPTRNFELYTHKPPILFWMMNLAWAIFGVSEIAARLVGPAFALLALWLTGRLARELWPDVPGIGGRAMMALAGLLPFAISGGLTMFDAGLAAATVAGILALLRAIETGKRRYWVGLGAALAIGGLIKGPVIFLHLLPALILAKLWVSGRAVVTWRQIFTGLAIALASGFGLVALWLVPAIIAGGPEYRDAVLWTQSAGRVSSSFSHRSPWWFFVAVSPFLLFPWLLVPSLWRSAVGQNWRDPALRLCLVWAGAAFVLFSAISGKQTHYLLPELPAAALIVARLYPGKFRIGIPAAIVLAGTFLVLLALAGLLPIDSFDLFVEPRWMLALIGLGMAAICLAAIRLQGLAGGMILSLGAVLAFNLVCGLTTLGSLYDTNRIASVVALHETGGIAYYGQGYHAQFNFTGRLTSAVANPGSAAELDRWRRAHPEGVVIARLDRDRPDWPEAQVITLRNAPFAVWYVADAPKPEPSS